MTCLFRLMRQYAFPNWSRACLAVTHYGWLKNKYRLSTSAARWTRDVSRFYDLATSRIVSWSVGFQLFSFALNHGHLLLIESIKDLNIKSICSQWLALQTGFWSFPTWNGMFISKIRSSPYLSFSQVTKQMLLLLHPSQRSSLIKISIILKTNWSYISIWINFVRQYRPDA